MTRSGPQETRGWRDPGATRGHLRASLTHDDDPVAAAFARLAGLVSGGSSPASMISPIRRACCGQLLAFVSRIMLPSNRLGATQRAASAVNQFGSLRFSTS